MFKTHCIAWHSIEELLEYGIEAWLMFDSDNEYAIDLICKWLSTPIKGPNRNIPKTKKQRTF